MAEGSGDKEQEIHSKDTVCVLTSEKTNWLRLPTGSIWHTGRRQVFAAQLVRKILIMQMTQRAGTKTTRNTKI